ncbi:MAG: hypothetical protein HY906_22985 [Deltaproteobacteria bacterium]|nr:hypothetical protein [Deltaproteobacteria bacterium]
MHAGNIAMAPRGRSGLALRVVIAGVLGAAAGPGCSGGASSRDKLADSLTLLTDAMRWQQWDTASNHVAPELRKAYLEAHESLADQIDVTDLEVTRRVAAPDGARMSVVIALSWLAKNDPVVKKTVLEQRWEPRRGTWLIVRERRLRGDPLPDPPRRRRAPATQPASRPA